MCNSYCVLALVILDTLPSAMLFLCTEYDAFNIVLLYGNENDVFDEYFHQMNIKKPTTPSMNGWTSWYNYYQNISEDIIIKNLHGLQKNRNIDIVQIDDGYQTYVGDWLDIDQKKFPNGMKCVVDAIHNEGYQAGLWLAPFVCETKSKIFNEHPEWILRDSNNAYVCAGSNWSRFYALNLELNEVKEYIKKVFAIVLDEWGFDLVKLDFLYAVSIETKSHKTRGQIMCEAMDFLRECVQDKLILACGVPLGPCFGKVDYCRIGCDVGLDWNDRFYMRLFHRERISTLHAIENTIARRHLNYRAFLNDPDVFLLRDENIKLNQTQKETLAFVNKLFGSLIFTSDDISQYTYQWSTFNKMLQRDDIEVLYVEANKDQTYEICYHCNQTKFIAYINLSAKRRRDLLPYQTKIVELKESFDGKI